MDIFVLVEPSVLSDDDSVSPQADDDFPQANNYEGDDAGIVADDHQDNKAKRQMPNSPPRPSNFLSNRTKRFRGSPSRICRQRSLADNNRITDSEEDDPSPKVPTPAPTTTSQRVLEAQERRKNQQERRIQIVHTNSVTRTTAALQRAESHLRSKVIKAYKFDERMTMVKEKRDFLDIERRVTLQSTSEQRRERVLRRAESNIQVRQDKARFTNSDRIAKVRERRSHLELERARALQDEIAARSRRATARAQQNLKSKQKRARFEEKIARAKTRRTLLQYERRSALLSSLDHRVQRASRNLDKQLQSRKERAGGEIRRARLVSRRVRAAKIIQRFARKAFGFSGTNLPTLGAQSELSQNEAAVLIQTWTTWKQRVAAGRFLSGDSAASKKKPKASGERIDDEEVCPKAALTKLVGIIAEEKDGRAPSFEAVRSEMTRSCTLRAARVFLNCLRPADRCTDLNDRTLLIAFLIASHATEVLGDDHDKDKCAKMLVKASQVLVTSIQKLLDALHGREASLQAPKKTGTNNLLSCIRFLCSSATAYGALFQVWKDADLNNLVNGMTKSAEQSWLAYLIASEALSYMSDLLATPTAKNEGTAKDPVLPLRLRHEASKSGSRSHIKRLRASLNKLVGTVEGLRIVKEAKASALRQMAADNVIATMKEEVDEFYKDSNRSHEDSEGAVPVSSSSDGSEGSNEEFHSGENVNNPKEEEPSPVVPDEVLSNEQLVHRVLLTDPSNFYKLTWDGESRVEPVCDKEFMANWLEGRPWKQTSSLHGKLGTDSNLQQLIGENLKKAFFDRIMDEMKGCRFEPVQDLLLDLHSRIRSLVPNRPDLHSYLRDDDARKTNTTCDILSLLRAAADAMAKLEAPNRASSTLNWISNASTFSQGRVGDGSPGGTPPYGFASEEEFLVASCAFLLLKVEFCQLDIANYRLQKVAPFVHQMGHEYELRQFKKRYDLDLPLSIESLKRNLPTTSAWLKSIVESTENQAESALANSAEKRLLHVRTRGFVDCLLFTKNRMEVPEVLALDSSRIQHIRNDARFVVIGCALGLHISSASRAGTAAFGQLPLPAWLEIKKEELLSALRAQYSSQGDFVVKVTDVAVSFAQALGGTNLESGAEQSLRNCVAAVLRGNDPVLKLLDNRMRQFFRVCCRWQATTSAVPMRTGRSVLRGESSTSAQIGGGNHHSSSKAMFEKIATKEASRLGFALFCNNLVSIGEMAYKVSDLMSRIYGEAVLDRLLVVGV